MGPTAFSELPFELFLVISAHLPLVYRPSTLLSLALTCHRLNEVVIPYLLYNAVRVEGVAWERVLRTLNWLTAKAAPANKEDIQKKGNPSPSHCIHHLCIESAITTNQIRGHFFNALQKLIEVDGLRHLSDLTLHIDKEWVRDGILGWDIDSKATNLTLPLLFLESLRKKCPHLKWVYLTELSQEFENKWIESDLFSNKVYNRS